MMSKTIKDAIDSRLSNIKISDDFESKVLSNSYKTRKIFKKPIAIVAAAVLCVVLSTTVMATTIPSFNKLLGIVSPQVAQFLRPIQLTSIDNGIKMEVIASMNDEDTTVVYLSIQDMKADRINDSLCIEHFELGDRLLRSMGTEIVSYDKATKTVILKVTGSGGEELEGKKATASFKSFYTDRNYKIVEADIDLSKIIGASATKTMQLTLKDDYTKYGYGGSGSLSLCKQLEKDGTVKVLKPDEKNIAMPDIDYELISNIGVIDGRLRIQLKRNGGTELNIYNYRLIDNAGNKIEASEDINFGKEGYSNQYKEYVFDIKESDLSKYKLEVEYPTFKNYTQGDWQVTFELEGVEKKEVDCDIKLDEIKINKAFVSPIGVTITGSILKKSGTDINKTSVNDEVLQKAKLSVETNNGDVVTLNLKSTQTSSDSTSDFSKFAGKYMFSEPIKLEDIKEISINGNVVALE